MQTKCQKNILHYKFYREIYITFRFSAHKDIIVEHYTSVLSTLVFWGVEQWVRFEWIIRCRYSAGEDYTKRLWFRVGFASNKNSCYRSYPSYASYASYGESGAHIALQPDLVGLPSPPFASLSVCLRSLSLTIIDEFD